MELVHETCKASKFVSEDAFDNLPDNVMTYILNSLPIQEAVRTGILSKKWRFKWTLLTRLVFDLDFLEYLEEKGEEKYHGRIISRILLNLKGAITKFDLLIPYKSKDRAVDVQDINNWVMFLSRKGIKELTLENMDETPLNLHTHLFSCLKLKQLKLYNCCLCSMSSFRGFPNLLSLDLEKVIFDGYTCGEFLTWCPLLEILILGFYSLVTHKIKVAEIAKLENIKVLCLPLCDVDNMATSTSSAIYELIGFFPKLQKLSLDFSHCKLLADAKKRVPTTLPCLKSLSLHEMDFSSDVMVSCAIGLICGSPKLETLWIGAKHDYEVPPPALCSSDVDFSKMGQLQLQSVMLVRISGLKNEECFIKSLLSGSPSLKEMEILAHLLQYVDDYKKLMFATQLLELHRASPVAEIKLKFL
ncbi:F-box/FBD/LRR-repeat protein-like protein [Tanacetum coccineum]